MSIFLPEGSQGKSLGVAGITPSNPTTTDEDFALMERVFAAAAARPNAVPEAFMAYVLDFIQTNNLIIPIGQVFGFSQFTATYATQGNADTTSATAFGDCTNGGHQVGPTIAALPAGKYVALFGSLAAVSAVGNIASMALEVNGSAVGGPPPIQGSAEARGTSLYSISTGTTITLTAASNTLKAVYAVDSGAVTGTFGSRWVIALKYDNA